MRVQSFLWLFILVVTLVNPGCKFLFGTMQDDTVDEIFQQGAIDPALIPDNVGYVPVLPFWQGFSNPVDVFVGYDEMVYVVDDNGLTILDLTGAVRRVIPVFGAVAVIQDRRIHTYVAGRILFDADNDGTPENLAAVYRIVNAATASQPFFADTLIHPFADVSRNNTAFRDKNHPFPDESVEFTSLAVTADNTLYVSRRGPRNDLTIIARPDNGILFFDAAGNNTGYANGLNPVGSSLKSVLSVSAIATFIGPPQALVGFSSLRDFVLLQQADAAEYKALWIRQVQDPETGVTHAENSALLNFDTTKAERFMYLPNRFRKPAGVCIAPDGSGYIFIVDQELDSLFQFTRTGFEGVNPPANSGGNKQIRASFGGAGAGPFQFNEPSGVAYYKRTVYVADKGNNRVCRYKLSTDLE